MAFVPNGRSPAEENTYGVLRRCPMLQRDVQNSGLPPIEVETKPFAADFDHERLSRHTRLYCDCHYNGATCPVVSLAAESSCLSSGANSFAIRVSRLPRVQNATARPISGGQYRLYEGTQRSLPSREAPASGVEVLRLGMVADEGRRRLLGVDLVVLGEDAADSLGPEEGEELLFV